MYMREMGAVDLLTREGEIAIAKRIEAGLNTVQQTLAEFPLAVSALLEEFAKTENGEGRLSDLVNGYGDPYANKEEEIPESSDDDEDSDTLVSGSDDDEDDDSAAPPEDAPNNQDALIEAREKLLELAAIHKKLMTALNKGKTLDDKKNQKLHGEIKEYIAAFSFPQKTIDLMEAQLNVAAEEIRDIERSISFDPANPSATKPLDLPKSNVLQFFLDDGTIVSARPSGTEPKIKFYINCTVPVPSHDDAGLAQAKKEAASLRDKIASEIKSTLDAAAE